MLDAGHLQDAIALANGTLALPLIFECGPAIHDIDELERAVVHVPLLHLVFDLPAVVPNEVGNEIALWCRF